jgi:hypothetical protein
VHRVPAAVSFDVSSSVAALDFGSPATMARSDAPTAPDNAAADPPPGVGDEERNAASRSVTE